MHAWAEIQHKLAYKNQSHIPNELKRKFSLISAKLEESDSQFEEIKNKIDERKQTIIEKAIKLSSFDKNLELNLDNLQTFLDFAFPDKNKDNKATTYLFDDMVDYNISLRELIEGYEKSLDYSPTLEKQICMKENLQVDKIWIQVVAARHVLELTCSKFYNGRIFIENELIIKYRNIINQKYSTDIIEFEDEGYDDLPF